jgi:hypothetical protein
LSNVPRVRFHSWVTPFRPIGKLARLTPWSTRVPKAWTKHVGRTAKTATGSTKNVCVDPRGADALSSWPILILLFNGGWVNPRLAAVRHRHSKDRESVANDDDETIACRTTAHLAGHSVPATYAFAATLYPAAIVGNRFSPATGRIPAAHGRPAGLPPSLAIVSAPRPSRPCPSACTDPSSR